MSSSASRTVPQTLLAVALTPVAYLGVAAVPLLVEHDVRNGHARWRRETAPALGERLGFAALFLVAAVVCTFFWGPFGPLAALMLTAVTWKVLGVSVRRSS